MRNERIFPISVLDRMQLACLDLFRASLVVGLCATGARVDFGWLKRRPY